MARYIDTQKVTVPRGFFNKDLGVPDLLKWLEAQPTADVVEVVQCKDCQYSCFIRSCSKYECQKGFGALKFSNDFCSYGRRKDEISKATDS